MAWSKLVSLEYDDEDKHDNGIEIAGKSTKPDYPWGLRISLTKKELDKLGLSDNPDIGDLIDMRAFAVVTSVSKHDGEQGSECRVELQIQRMAVENEMDEDEKD
jgi:hypothetical protein